MSVQCLQDDLQPSQRANQRAPQALWVSPPRYDPSEDAFMICIDYSRQKFGVCYSDLAKPPDTCNFPNLPDARITKANQSQLERDCWERSTFVAAGSYGHIRRLDDFTMHVQFPMVKLAHDNALARRLIRIEFEKLQLFRMMNFTDCRIGRGTFGG